MKDKRLLHHIRKVAECPSFSTYEERLHPYIYHVFDGIPQSEELKVPGNNLVFRIGDHPDRPMIAVTAHLDKINHFGEDVSGPLPVTVTEDYIEGAMDDSIGVGLLLRLAEAAKKHVWPNMLFLFSEMEESKGLKKHPELLKNRGEGYTYGMGARRIARRCIARSWLPDEIITLDTTPLFKGASGIALYARHWELNALNASSSLEKYTDEVIEKFRAIHPNIELHNNTNDYLHYGYEFNTKTSKDVVSIALEPSIYPYHQQGERVWIRDISRISSIMKTYFNSEFITE